MATMTRLPLFLGQYFDAETGLHQNYFRDYDPKTGRYIEADPIGLAGGINLYPYMDSSRVNDEGVEGLKDLPLIACVEFLES